MLMTTETNSAQDLLVRTPQDVDETWLSSVLGVPIETFEGLDPIGTGQMSQNFRIRYTDADGQGSVVIKLASADARSRETGVMMRAYWREVEFYRVLSPRLGWPVPRCHLAVYDETDGWFTLVLDDVEGGVQGDQIAGCDVDTARTALIELAAVQAPVLGDEKVGQEPWLMLPNMLTQELLSGLLPAFLDRYEGRIAPEHAAVCERFVAVLDAWWESQQGPRGLMHGDFRLDNLLFVGETAAVVDWQTVIWGPAVLDVSYFLGGALDPEVRAEHERDLVRCYHAELLRRGVTELGLDHCWDEYRRWAFWGLAMVIGASMLVVQTHRGDDMFMTLLDRACRQVIDLDALAFLPVTEPSA